MKFTVDEMPKDGECPFTEWVPYPPFIEEPGRWICKKADKMWGNTPRTCDCKASYCVLRIGGST